MVGPVAVAPCLRVGEVGAVGEGAADAEPLRISRLGAFSTFSLQTCPRKFVPETWIGSSQDTVLSHHNLAYHNITLHHII